MCDSPKIRQTNNIEKKKTSFDYHYHVIDRVS